MSKKRILPYVKQPENSTLCGAACLEMLFRYYGLKDTQEEIAPYVVGGDKNDCRTSLMLQYAWEKGVPMVGIQPAGKPETCMDMLLCLGYDLLVLFYPEFDPNHPEKGASYGHWVLVSYIENGKIYFIKTTAKIVHCSCLISPEEWPRPC